MSKTKTSAKSSVKKEAEKSVVENFSPQENSKKK
jgi:hypothetical protein